MSVSMSGSSSAAISAVLSFSSSSPRPEQYMDRIYSTQRKMMKKSNVRVAHNLFKEIIFKKCMRG